MEVMASRAQGWASLACPFAKPVGSMVKGADGRISGGARSAAPDTECMALGVVRSPPWIPRSSSARWE